MYKNLYLAPYESLSEEHTMVETGLVSYRRIVLAKKPTECWYINL